MNIFTITFKNREGEIKREDFVLDFFSVQSVLRWFEDNFGIRPRSISKH